MIKRNLRKVNVVLFCILAVLFFIQTHIIAATDKIALSSSTVSLNEQALFVVSEPLLSLSAQERAERVTNRIEKIAKDKLFNPEKIEVIDGELATDIGYGNFVIMSVSDKDASSCGMSRQELAEQNALIIKNAILNYKKTYSIKQLIINAFLALLFTVLFIILLKLTNITFAKSKHLFEIWAKNNIKGFRFQKVELLPAYRITEFFIFLLTVSKIILILLLAYLYITIVFGLFPWTSGLSYVFIGYILHPVKLLLKSSIAYIPNLFFVIVVFIFTYYISKFLRKLSLEIKRGRIVIPSFYPDWAQPTYQIIRFLLWAFALVIMFPYLPGANSPAFKGISVFLGVLFSLGSSSAISNMVSGVILTYMRPFKSGDIVKINDTVGVVVEKELLITRIRTIKNVYITVPNSLVMASHIVNYSSLSENQGLILNTTVTLGYDVAWVKVHELLMNAAKKKQKTY